jgi:hypothetical protein
VEQILLHAAGGGCGQGAANAGAGMITIEPPKFKNRDDRDRTRVILARHAMWELLAAAKKQMGVLRWINEGWLELEEFATCLDTGGLHPWLKEWKQKRSGAANRPTSSERELYAQHLICLATVALERAFSLTRAQARDIVARKAARLFARPPSVKAIEHWQANQPPLSAVNEQVLVAAIDGSRVGEPGGHDRLVDHFIAAAHAFITPGTLISHHE